MSLEENTREDQTTEVNPQEAIIQIRTLQRTHHQEIKQLKEKLDDIEARIDSHNTTTTKRLEDGFKNIKEEMATTMITEMKKFQQEARDQQEQQTTTVARMFQELSRDLKDVHQSWTNPNDGRPLETRTLTSEDNTNYNSEIISASDISEQQLNIPSTRTVAEISTNQINPEGNNKQKLQTILLPAPTTPPIFHGKSTERPWQFLIQVADYAETSLRWEEETLLRGISQFLKDTAFEWYCQLRKYHALPRTWNDFKEIFMEQFNSPGRKAQLKQQWKECKQSHEETTKEFIVRLRAIWAEQYPTETEKDLIKHLFCKMRPDILNIMGCPRNASLSEILLEAGRVEEILHDRAKTYSQQNIQSNKMNDYSDNTDMQNLNAIYSKGTYPTNSYQRYSNQRRPPPRQQARRDPRDKQQLICYYCHRPNHKARDCWYNKENQKTNPLERPTAITKNE